MRTGFVNDLVINTLYRNEGVNEEIDQGIINSNIFSSLTTFLIRMHICGL